MIEKEKTVSLKERMTKLRSATDYKLPLKSYVIVCIDGHSFSKLIKNKYKKPFDDKFINMMNEVGKYVCKKVEGCKFAYTQSDEITFVLTDFETENTYAYFGNRLTKILSIIPAMATAKFNQMVFADLCDTQCSNADLKQMIMDAKLADFDCKAFSVDNFNDVYAYILWRQMDCIRNSKQQTAQTWLSHKTLERLDTDEQIKLLLDKKGIDWNTFDDGKKYGRFIYKVVEHYHNDDLNTDYDRSVWKAFDAFPIMGENNKKKFIDMHIIPDINYCRTKEAIPKDLEEEIRILTADDDIAITKSTNFYNDLAFDSLDLVELTIALEKKYNIKFIPEDGTIVLNTVQDLINELEKRGVRF